VAGAVAAVPADRAAAGAAGPASAARRWSDRTDAHSDPDRYTDSHADPDAFAQPDRLAVDKSFGHADTHAHAVSERITQSD
jgi:hypothetical protein